MNDNLKKQSDKAQAELDFYKKLNPEAAIFFRKKALTVRLLKISVADLKNASEQSWYEEYIALLAIRLENPTLNFLAKKYCEKLLLLYNKNINHAERELSVLGMIQFLEPTELKIPFNQHLWSKKMVRDVQAVFLNQYTEVNYTDADIATYYLFRQSMRRYERRKIRVAFMANSFLSGEKILPVYEAMKKRDDFETFLIVYAGADYKYLDRAWDYFREKYPDDKIYNYGLMDLQKLAPDYVFLPNPYDSRRTFPGFRTNDIVKFAKVCIISYGATLSNIFSDRLFDEFPNFWRNVYLYFASAETVKNDFEKKFPQDISMDYQHVEFFGYPALKPYYRLEKESYAAKNILWAPRWNFDDKIGGSHFMNYKDNFVALAKKYGEEVELILRPHPDLFNELMKKKFMTEKEITAYDELLKKNNILRQTTLANMFKSIRKVDIFLTDYSSVMIEFFLTGRPIIYCEYPRALPLPEYEEMFKAMYIAHSWKEIEHYLEDLLNGNDPLFDKRQEIAKKIYETHKDATEKIIARIVQDFNAKL
ncbi:MAG: CDP-glycerol glycerophosphotransferase family protein [Selenomonadaceae bacterium]|nr:CDP-glycerol glycerophosphotransferase family protein [Selenomonadaceae bacterium]